MITLAIDTSAYLCAAALHDDGDDRIVAESSVDIGRGHAEMLMDIIAEVLGAAGIGYADLGRIAACAGPGSFTGVRVGLATARGVALGLNVPAIGVSALEALAGEARVAGAGASDGAPLMVLLDARRGQAYGQVFSDARGDFPAGPFVADYGAIAAMIPAGANLALCGSGAPVLMQAHAVTASVLHALPVAPVARYARIGAAAPAGGRPEPLYLRPPDAKPQAGFAVARG